MNQIHALNELDKVLKEWNSTKVGRRHFLYSMPLLLSSCATQTTSDRYREGSNKGQKSALTVKQEQEMTKEAMVEMKKDYPPLKNQYAQEYINYIGQSIVQSNKLHKKPYTYNFTVVDVDYVNAFALPAGTIMVTAPLIKMAETEAELAGVVGHEIGHVKARHTAERIYKARKEQEKSTWFGAVGGLLGGAAGYTLGKALCKPKDNECLQKATLYGAAAGAGGALLIQKYGFMANSREDEMEADRISFHTAVKTGYSKNHVGLFYSKLLAMEKKAKGNQKNSVLGSLADALSTHPPSQERVNQINTMIRESKYESGGKVNSPAFHKIKRIV